MGYGLYGRGSISVKDKAIYSPLRNVQNGSGAHPASCITAIGGVKLTICFHLLLTSKMANLYHHYPLLGELLSDCTKSRLRRE